MQYRDISIEEFVALAEKRRVVVFGTGRLLQRAWEQLVAHGMNADCVRLFMDNGRAGTSLTLGGRTWAIQSVEAGVRSIAPDDLILITPYEPFAAMSEQLEAYGLTNICCLYSLFEVQAMLAQGRREMYPTRRAAQPLIPRVIHYCWFGGREMPDWQKHCVASWHRYCPDYEFRLWNEENYDIHRCQYMADAYASGRMGFVPDFARLDVLYQYGGVYLDTDVELLRPLDELLYQSAFCGAQVGNAVNLGSGFGCVPGLEIIRELRDEYRTAVFRRADGTYELTSSPTYQTRTLARHGYRTDNTYQVIDDLAVYPSDVFCGPTCLTGRRDTTPNSYALHLPSLSWANLERISAAGRTLRMIQEKFVTA